MPQLSVTEKSVTAYEEFRQNLLDVDEVLRRLP